MKTSLALAALLLAGAVSAPVLASDNSSFDGDWYVTQLQHKGVDAVAAYEGAPGEVRAVVQTADGKQIFQYFDDETLAPIGGNTGTNTRVLTKLDVGTKAAPVNEGSLLVDNFFD
jgi:redox-regulated HSP33 family molecular chaperone